jgi:pimeloyl-ACP methyl ester carboxylesterase
VSILSAASAPVFKVRRRGLALLAGTLTLSACTGLQGQSDSMMLPLPDKVATTEGLADIGNAKLWYWDTGGSGAAVVFFHPGSGSAEFYPYQQAALSKAGYRVISYSRRGQHPSELGSDSATHFSADDALKLMNFLKVDKFHAVGNALGGYIALDLAVMHPERVLSLVVACSMMGISEPDYQRTLMSLRPKEFEALPMELKELGPSYRAKNPAGVLEWRKRHDRAGARAPVRLKSKLDWAALAGLRTPTLLMTGDADLWIPPALLKDVAKRIPGSRVVVVADSGHGVQWEQPVAFNQALLEFFRRLP